MSLRFFEFRLPDFSRDVKALPRLHVEKLLSSTGCASSSSLRQKEHPHTNKLYYYNNYCTIMHTAPLLPAMCRQEIGQRCHPTTTSTVL